MKNRQSVRWIRAPRIPYKPVGLCTDYDRMKIYAIRCIPLSTLQEVASHQYARFLF